MNPRQKTTARAAFVGGAAILATAALFKPAARPPASRPNPVAPAATLRTAQGFVPTTAAALKEHIRRSGAKGTVVGAWASWCGSCKEELPLLLRAKETFAGSIDVVLVSVDEAEAMPKAKELLDGMNAPEPRYVVAEPLETFKPAMSPKWPGMLPASFLFDGRAKLHYFWGGTVYENEIVPLLRRYLAGENIDGEANFALAPGAVTH